MGMVVRQLPGGEIQPAMKTGLIDAAEFNNPTSDSRLVCKMCLSIII